MLEQNAHQGWYKTIKCGSHLASSNDLSEKSIKNIKKKNDDFNGSGILRSEIIPGAHPLCFVRIKVWNKGKIWKKTKSFMKLQQSRRCRNLGLILRCLTDLKNSFKCIVISCYNQILCRVRRTIIMQWWCDKFRKKWDLKMRP